MLPSLLPLILQLDRPFTLRSLPLTVEFLLLPLYIRCGAWTSKFPTQTLLLRIQWARSKRFSLLLNKSLKSYTLTTLAPAQGSMSILMAHRTPIRTISSLMPLSTSSKPCWTSISSSVNIPLLLLWKSMTHLTIWLPMLRLLLTNTDMLWQSQR